MAVRRYVHLQGEGKPPLDLQKEDFLAFLAFLVFLAFLACAVSSVLSTLTTFCEKLVLHQLPLNLFFFISNNFQLDRELDRGDT